MGDVLLRTEVDVELRSIDEGKRQATFVCSTERAVPMWDGPEVLRSSGADLKRFKRNPVLLDSHDRSTIEAVLGSAEIAEARIAHAADAGPLFGAAHCARPGED